MRYDIARQWNPDKRARMELVLDQSAEEWVWFQTYNTSSTKRVDNREVVDLCPVYRGHAILIEIQFDEGKVQLADAQGV